MNRVVITGIGVVSPLGNDLETFWDRIKKGEHGILAITKFDTANFPVKLAAEVKEFNPLLCLNKKEVKRNDPYRLGVYIGSGVGGIHTLEEEYGHFLTKGGRFVSPFTIPKLISNMASGEVAIEYGFKGKNFNITSACVTSTNTIGEAFSAIKAGKLDVCLSGGGQKPPLQNLHWQGFII